MTSVSKEQVLKAMRKKLRPTQLKLFRQTCLGHLLDLKDVQFLGNFMHNMLLHELVMEGVEKEMWLLIEGTTIRFSYIEFRLTMGLTFESYPSDMEGSMRLRNMYFDGG